MAGEFDFGGFDLGGGGGGGGFDLSSIADQFTLGAPASPGLSASATALTGAAGPLDIPPSGGGWGQTIGDIAKMVMPVAQLGLTGLGIAGGIQSMQRGAGQQALLERAQRQQAQTAGPAAAAGAQLTEAGSAAMLAGALPEGLQAQADQWRNDTRAKMRAYLAKAGITDSTMAQQYEGWIEMQYNVLKEQLAQHLLESGYSGIKTALGPTEAIERAAFGEMGGLDTVLKEANQALALLAAQTDKKKPETS